MMLRRLDGNEIGAVYADCTILGVFHAARNELEEFSRSRTGEKPRAPSLAWIGGPLIHEWHQCWVQEKITGRALSFGRRAADFQRTHMKTTLQSMAMAICLITA